jgi:hypothetical protein
MARVLGVHPMFFLQGFPETPAPSAPSGFHEEQASFETSSGSSDLSNGALYQTYCDATPEFAELIDLFAQIDNPAVRSHVLEVVRALSVPTPKQR